MTMIQKQLEGSEAGAIRLQAAIQARKEHKRRLRLTIELLVCVQFMNPTGCARITTHGGKVVYESQVYKRIGPDGFPTLRFVARKNGQLISVGKALAELQKWNLKQWGLD